MKNKYLLPCSCGRKMVIEASQAGEKLRCACGAELEAPTMLGIAKLEPAEPDRESDTPAPTWGVRHRLLLFGGLIAAIGLGVVLLTWRTWPTKGDFSAISPFMSLQVWHNLKQGIGVPPNLADQMFADAIRWHFRWLAVGAAVALVGIAVIAAAPLFGRRPPREALHPDDRGAAGIRAPS